MERKIVISVLIIMIFLYMSDVILINDITNYSFSLATLCFSISLVFDTYAKKNKFEYKIKNLLKAFALIILIIFPLLKDVYIITRMMECMDNNIVLLLSIVFTLLGQWAVEIKVKDIERLGEKNVGRKS